MADDDESLRFRFECEGIEVELEGDNQFVERMYRKLMRDIDTARRSAEPSDESQSTDDAPPSSDTDAPLQRGVVWLIRCSDMMRRVYMLDPIHFQRSALDNCLDSDRVASLYVDRDTMKAHLSDIVDQHRTLWARLTETGHDQLAASDDS